MVASAPPELAELPGPVGLQERFCLDFAIALVIDKPFKQWSGGDYRIYDLTKQLRLQSEGKLSLARERRLRDSNGHPIFVSRTARYTWDSATTICDSEGEAVVRLSSDPKTWKYNISAVFFDAFSKQERTIRLVSRNWKEDATLTLDDEVIGFVSKDVSLGANRRLHVAKNVDYALMVQIVIYYDSLATED